MFQKVRLLSLATPPSLQTHNSRRSQIVNKRPFRVLFKRFERSRASDYKTESSSIETQSETEETGRTGSRSSKK